MARVIGGDVADGVESRDGRTGGAQNGVIRAGRAIAGQSSMAVGKAANGEDFETRIGLKSGDAENAASLAGYDHPAGGVNGQSVQTIVAAIAEIHWKNW